MAFGIETVFSHWAVKPDRSIESKIDLMKERFPRTQMAVGRASNVADVTIMFDNSLGTDQAFRIARVQRRSRVLYDCRKSSDPSSRELSVVASPWLGIVSPI